MVNELVDDLILVIARYTDPFTTYNMLTIGPGLAINGMRVAVWRDKTLVERFALVYSNEQMRTHGCDTAKGWHAYYRGSCYRTSSTLAYVKRDDEADAELIQLDGTTKSFISIFDRNYLVIGETDTLYFYHEHPATRYANIVKRPVFARLKRAGEVCITERGQLFTFITRSEHKKLSALERIDIPTPESVVSAVLDDSGKAWIILQRDGTILKTAEIGTRYATVQTLNNVVRLDSPRGMYINDADLYNYHLHIPATIYFYVNNNGRGMGPRSVNELRIPSCRTWLYNRERYVLGIDGIVRTIDHDEKDNVVIKDVALGTTQPIKDIANGPNWIAYLV